MYCEWFGEPASSYRSNWSIKKETIKSYTYLNKAETNNTLHDLLPIILSCISGAYYRVNTELVLMIKQQVHLHAVTNFEMLQKIEGWQNVFKLIFTILSNILSRHAFEHPGSVIRFTIINNLPNI